MFAARVEKEISHMLPIRKLLLFLIAAIAGCVVFACSAPKVAATEVEITPSFTVRDIMQSIVQPGADTLWNAVAISVTEKGPETKAPKNDEEWEVVRHNAIALSEAMNLVLIPGRKMAQPGEKAKDTSVEL